MSEWSMEVNWYFGLCFGVAWDIGCLFVMLGPVQLEFWRYPSASQATRLP